MSKRSRSLITPTRLEQQEDELASEQSSLQLPIHSAGFAQTSTSASGSSGNREITVHSKAKGHCRGGNPNLGDLLTLIFPKCKLRYLTYGRETTAIINNNAAVELAGGNGHGIGVPIGSQDWFSYCHLPLFDRKGFRTSYSTVLQLEEETYTNSQNIANSQFWSPVSTDPLSTIKGSYRSLFYSGGHTKHTFYNPGTVDVFVELVEARPKRFLLSSETPLATLCVDKVVNAERVTGLSLTTTNFTATTTSYLQPQDLNFGVSPHDHLSHDKFLFSKPRYQKIVPGETFHYVVRHPPYKYTNSPWWKSMIFGNTATAGGANLSDMDYAPFCTVWLLVRLKGGIITTDNGTVALESTPGTLTVGVNTSAVQLAHLQSETHYTRPGLYQQEYNESYVNLQKEAINATATFVSDPLENNVEQTKL